MNGRSAMRLARLQEALVGGGTIHLSEAARLCGVSEMTIRRDVAASDGAIVFIGGRLVMADNPQFAPVYDLDEQRGSHYFAKQRLCHEAAAFIEEGDTLFIDCGTTLMPLVSLLSSFNALTVVTYALNVASAVAALPGVRLILLGGLYHDSSQSFGSDDMDEAIERLGINKAFISAAGVDPERGVSCFHFHEVAPKRAAIAAATQCILVVDETKLGVIRPARFAGLEAFDVLICDGEAGQALSSWQRHATATRIRILLA
ncbi:DeoR/GlpR family DNA-binding transcription regulator [Halomonas urumqiensis]|uniref:DeoR family transcriptional regulator n=1 Tax=Halomonas urumqiensis TaxID=1684789 RepID=A0A2N7UDB9_9GAMM|nr:DeoR/GlpR family DNA-binding transcription regulator [Halomonas urumqiensis]PMR78417.1 DeoR family transcriptional regulator [Halomonas urumqiensis]PTB03563.1 DeoR/GlpR transcriptional regulator [Halomonas urumqiensis]GHE20235.1 DeoR family transcriptional regulator [Halomonas urumqiensis]